MAIMEINPLVLKDIELIIGAGTDDYRKHVDQVVFTPSASSVSWTGLGLNTHTDVSTATWTLGLRYAQDWGTADSLSQYLYENEGETVQIRFRPRSGVGPAFVADVVITPGAIGGDVNAYSVATVTLGLVGRPEIDTDADGTPDVDEA